MTARKKEPDAPDPAEAQGPDASGPQPAGDLPVDLQAQCDDLLARLQRLTADYLNYQKRVQKDIDEARTFANADLIKSLLPVLDDMERALDAARENHGQQDPLYAGLQLVHDKALETFRKFGVARIVAAGQPFDPEIHAAMMQHPTNDYPPQTVIQEAQSGYTLAGRTLRPAAVIVAVAPEDPSDEFPEADDQE